MATYAAFIGHQPHISIGELAASVPGFRSAEIFDNSVVLFEATGSAPEKWLSRLGGTIVLAEMLPIKNPSLEDIPKILHEQVKDVKGKVTFSLRTAGLNPKQIRTLYRNCKDELRKHSRASRYVGNEHKPAIAVILHDTGILNGEHGCELCVLKRKDQLWIGVTRDAQDVDAYSKRDMEKPVRDTTVGLLPPKLAQVLLNFGVWLAGGDLPRPLKDDKRKATRPFTVFDPFCGTGVIPIECLLRGHAVMASDVSEKAITGTKKNLDWVRKQWTISKDEQPAIVWKQNATKAFDFEEHVLFGKGVLPDVIVTETSLGPNLRGRPTTKEIQSMRSENEKLQIDFLKNAHATLPGIPIACTWPVWYSSKVPVRLEKAWEQLGKIGYEAVLPPNVRASDDRPSLIYRRPEQMVGREIVLLKPLKK